MSENESIVQVRVDQEKLDAIVKGIGSISGGFPRVMSRAINRTMDSGRVRIARFVDSQTKIGVRQARAKMYIRRATKVKLQGFLGLSESDFDLTRYFDAQYTQDEGVDVQVLPGRRTFLPRAFMVSRTAAAGLGWSVKRKWWGGGKVLMRKPQSGETPRWDTPNPGALAPRFPVMRVRGPSLADLWQDTPAMVADVVGYSQHTLEHNARDQVIVLLKDAGLSGEQIAQRLADAGL